MPFQRQVLLIFIIKLGYTLMIQNIAFFDPVQLGEACLDVALPFWVELALVRLISVSSIDFIHVFHALDDFPKRCLPGALSQACSAVIPDPDLRAPGICEFGIKWTTLSYMCAVYYQKSLIPPSYASTGLMRPCGAPLDCSTHTCMRCDISPSMQKIISGISRFPYPAKAMIPFFMSTYSGQRDIQPYSRSHLYVMRVELPRCIITNEQFTLPCATLPLHKRVYSYGNK